MKKILIIEDDTYIRDLLSDILSIEGYAVEKFKDGKEALDSLRHASSLPQLILLDLRMPVMDGFAFREEQRKDPRLASIPTIVLSAGARLEETGEQLDVVGVLKKPFSIDELMSTTSRVLQ